MKDKFKDIKVEDDVRLIKRSEMNTENFEAVHERWVVDGGIYAESIIFCSEDVKDLSEEQIKEEVRNTNLPTEDSQMTFRRSKETKYTFVNFNFVVP